MELNAIYIKTAQGDEAVQQRTRLVQRNLRTVLIVVDGRSTVTELVDKVGNLEMVLSSLEQLERDGYIEVALNGPLEGAAEIAEPQAEAGREPAASPFAYPPEVPPISPVPEATVEPIEPVVPVPEPASSTQATKAAVAELAADDDPFLTPGKVRKAEKAAAPAQSKKNIGGKLGGMFKRKETAGIDKAAKADAAISMAAIRRGPRPKHSIYSIAAMTIGGFIALVLLAVFAFPYDIYRADIERALGASLAQSVKISGVRASFSPTPALILDRVEIGESVAIKEVRATPEIASLFSAEKRFSKVVIAGGSIDAAHLLSVVPAAGRLASGGGFAVRTLSFSAIDLRIQDLELKDWAGEFSLSAGSQAALTLRNAPGSLTLEIKPAGDALLVAIEGRGWVPAEGTPFVWDFLSAQGEIRGDSLSLRKIDGRMFDGVIQGQAIVGWAANGVSIRAELGLEHGSAKRIAAALGSGIGFDGDLNARLRFVAAGEGWLKARDSLRVEGDLGVKRGSLQGLDFADAIRRSGQAASRGGSTNFDQMTGSVLVNSASTRFTNIEVVSGAMRATGSVTVAAVSRQISGNLDVRLRGGGVDVRMPVTLAGTLKDPQLFGGRR